MRERRRIRFTLACLLTLLLFPASCGGTGTVEIALSPIPPRGSFALYYPVQSSTAPRVPAYAVSPDLSNVAGAAGAGLPAGLVRALGTQGCAATPGGEDRLYEVYRDREGAKFVTVDAMLQAFNLLSSYALREMESERFRPDLRSLVASLHAGMEGMYDGADGRVRDAAAQVLAYLGVAARLLGLEADVPPEVKAEVDDELALIAGHAGPAASPIFGYGEDYGQYSPHGHYGGDPGLEGYFQAITWLGRMGFYPSPGSGPADILRGRDMTRQAILLVGALHMGEVEGEPALKAWDRIYQPTAFLLGTSGGLDVYDFTRLIGEVYGSRFPLGRLADEATLDVLIDRVLEEGGAPPATIGVPGEDEGGGGVSFSLFGQRCAPDSHIFQQLVADEVPGRLMPRGLDLPAALGSDRALEILTDVYGEAKYPEYAVKVDELRRGSALIDPAQAHTSVYGAWTEIMRPMLEPCGEGFPAFMRSQAWLDRGLYAFLGSWAELRHDTVLYAGPGNEAGTAPAQNAQKGYVEPLPDAYARLAAITDMLERGLSDRDLASPAVEERLGRLYRLLLGLQAMAEKELRNEPLTPEEYQIIADIGGTLEYLATFPRGKGEDAPRSGGSTALVTDVHVDPAYGEVLEAAVGRPCVVYVIAPVEGTPTLAVGAGYSYYELVRPMEERLSDAAWREMVEAGRLPQDPAWTATFLR